MLISVSMGKNASRIKQALNGLTARSLGTRCSVCSEDFENRVDVSTGEE